MFSLETLNLEVLLFSTGIAILKIIAVFIGFKLVKRVGIEIIGRSFEKLAQKQNISQGRALTLQRLTENIFSYGLIFIVVATVFNIFGLSVASLVAGAGIVGLAVGFGAQGLVSDVVTGFFLLLEKQIDVNDYVTVGSFSGIVQGVGLRTTEIRGFDGTVHYLPNRDITSVSNHSRGNMRALVDISIAYGENIDEAITVIQGVCERMGAEDPAIAEGPNVVGVQALGSSDVVLRVVAKTANGEQWGIERKLRKAIKEALDANGIEIPFPHHVIVQKER